MAGAVKLTGLVDMTLAPALRVAVTQGEPLVKLRPSSPALSATVSCSHALASSLAHPPSASSGPRCRSGCCSWR